MSAIVLVCGTTTSIVGTRGQPPRVEMMPRDGVYAHSALLDAGARPDDHVSSPMPKAQNDCGGGGARSIRRAGAERSGEVVSVVGAFRAAVYPTLHAAIGHRRHVGQTDQDRAGVTQPLDHERVLLRYQVGERRTACRRGESAREVTVLGGIGNSVQRTACPAAAAACVGRLGVGAGLRVQHHDGVQPDPRVVIEPRSAPGNCRADRPRSPGPSRAPPVALRWALRRRRTVSSLAALRRSRTRAGWPPTGSARAP